MLHVQYHNSDTIQTQFRIRNIRQHMNLLRRPSMNICNWLVRGRNWFSMFNDALRLVVTDIMSIDLRNWDTMTASTKSETLDSDPMSRCKTNIGS